jgi:hypothetical protein
MPGNKQNSLLSLEALLSKEEEERALSTKTKPEKESSKLPMPYAKVIMCPSIITQAPVLKRALRKLELWLAQMSQTGKRTALKALKAVCCLFME